MEYHNPTQLTDEARAAKVQKKDRGKPQQHVCLADDLLKAALSKLELR